MAARSALETVGIREELRPDESILCRLDGFYFRRAEGKAKMVKKKPAEFPQPTKNKVESYPGREYNYLWRPYHFL